MEILIIVILAVVIMLYGIFRTSGVEQQPVELPPLPKTLELLPAQPRFSYTIPPPIPAEIPQPFDYQADWWHKLSEWYRDQLGWRCEECDISLNEDRHLLHTHHIWGTQYNEPTDLKALCIGCHAEQPGEEHGRLKCEPDYTHFIREYGKQWRLYRQLNVGNL